MFIVDFVFCVGVGVVEILVVGHSFIIFGLVGSDRSGSLVDGFCVVCVGLEGKFSGFISFSSWS